MLKTIARNYNDEAKNKDQEQIIGRFGGKGLIVNTVNRTINSA